MPIHSVSPWSPHFLYTVCQRGAEEVLKGEVTGRSPSVRPSFSRPGFVTFKLDAPSEKPESFAFPSTFARAWGFSLGHLTGSSSHHMAQQVWNLPEFQHLQTRYPIRALHVWQRDSDSPGHRGFQPGPTPLADQVHQILQSQAPAQVSRDIRNTHRHPAPLGAWVLDVVLVEPNEWWLGCHQATGRFTRWAGGVFPLTMPASVVSRAYIKMAEALKWSIIPISRGDHWIELGCAPGGASQMLLERGMRVTGVDPAMVDPLVTDHPHFTHLRMRSAEIPKKRLQGISWLAADINGTPTYTLDAVEAIVTHPQTAIRGMVLTLKLADWNLAQQVPQFRERVSSWGYRDIRTRQLAHNRKEFCLIALRSRGGRRVPRQYRHDPPHTGIPKGPH